MGKHEKEVQGAKQEYQGAKQEYQGARQEYDGDKKNRGKAAPAQDLRGYFQVTMMANVLDLLDLTFGGIGGPNLLLTRRGSF